MRMLGRKEPKSAYAPMTRRTAIWMAKLMPLQSRMMLLVVRLEPAKKTVSLSGPPMAMACWLRRFWEAVGAKLKRWRPCCPVSDHVLHSTDLLSLAYIIPNVIRIIRPKLILPRLEPHIELIRRNRPVFPQLTLGIVTFMPHLDIGLSSIILRIGRDCQSRRWTRVVRSSHCAQRKVSKSNSAPPSYGRVRVLVEIWYTLAR